MLVAALLNAARPAAGPAVGGERSALTAAFRINGYLAGGVSRGAPAVAGKDTQDEFLVVWEDSRDWSRGQDIYGRPVGAGGSPGGGDVCVCGPDATKCDYAPAPAWNDDADRHRAVWGDNRSSQITFWDVRGRPVAG